MYNDTEMLVYCEEALCQVPSDFLSKNLLDYYSLVNIY